MARLGMDVDLVEEKGRALKADAEKLSQLIRQLEGTVRRLPSVWDGKDARDFVTTWWPQHKQSLQHSVDAVSGLGQSALSNAAEQRDVSGSMGSSGGVSGSQVAGIHSSSTGGVLPDLTAGGSDSLLAIYSASKGNVNFLDKSASASAAVYTASLSGSTTLVDGVVAAGGATVSVLAASASANASLKLVNGIPVAEAGASAEADLVKASAKGSIKAGNVGLEGDASGKVGAAASGKVGVTADEHGLKAEAGIDAEATASASASAGLDIGGIEPKVTGTVYAGVGLTADASAQITDSYVGAHVTLGASLGFGGAVSFDIGVHPAEIAKTFGDVMNAITSFKL
jgi:uncharacterized protein YukE